MYLDVCFPHALMGRVREIFQRTLPSVLFHSTRRGLSSKLRTSLHFRDFCVKILLILEAVQGWDSVLVNYSCSNKIIETTAIFQIYYIWRGFPANHIYYLSTDTCAINVWSQRDPPIPRTGVSSPSLHRQEFEWNSSRVWALTALP